MAFSMGGSNGGMRGRRFGASRAGGSTLSEMNVVPLVDVVLVLLIIFMLTAQAMEFGLEIKVPEVIQVKDTSEDLPVINITRDGKILLGDKPVGIHAMADEIARRHKGAKAVYVRADRETVYDPIAQVVSTLSAAKYDVKLVTKPLESKR
jgi:biopolymer transport protein ExbD